MINNIGFNNFSKESTFILPPPPPVISVWDGTTVGQRWIDLWSKPDRDLGDLVIFPSGEIWRYSFLNHPGVGSQGIWLPWTISTSGSPTVRCWFDESVVDFDQLVDQGFTDIVSSGGGTIDYSGSGIKLISNGGVISRIELGSNNTAFVSSPNTFIMGFYQKEDDGTVLANGHILGSRLNKYDVRLFAQGNSAGVSSHIRYTTSNNALTANVSITQINPRLNPAINIPTQFSLSFLENNAVESRLNQRSMWCRTAIEGGSGGVLFAEVNDTGRVFLSSEKPNVVDQQSSIRFFKWYALTF